MPPALKMRARLTPSAVKTAIVIALAAAWIATLASDLGGWAARAPCPTSG